MKAVIKDEMASFYINDSEEPVLVVKDLKHGKGIVGHVGLFVDIGTEGFFKDLVVIPEEV